MPTDVVSLVHDLNQVGSLGLLVAFLIWKDIRSERVRDKLAEKHAAEVQLMQERRLQYDKDRLDVDKQQVAVLSALNSSIQSIGRK